MSTDNNHNHNNNTTQPQQQQPLLAPAQALGECARLLVAARLAPAQAALLSHATLLATLTERGLVTVAKFYFGGLVALAERRHAASADAPSFAVNARKLLSMYLIVLHPTQIFGGDGGDGSPEDTAVNAALLAAATALLRTFGALLLASTTTATVGEAELAVEEEQLPLELTAPLLPQLRAYDAAYAAFQALDEPRFVRRLHTLLVHMINARMVAEMENDVATRLQIDVQMAHHRGLLSRVTGGDVALAALDATMAAASAVVAAAAAAVAAEDSDDEDNNDAGTRQQPEAA